MRSENRPVLLDTHALVWFSFGEANLGSTARRLMDLAGRDDRLQVSAISFWEVALLTRRGKLNLFQPSSDWRKSVLQLGIREIPVTGDIGIQATELENFHRDPADRIITATAILQGAVLVTADSNILEWQGALQRHDARS